MSWEAWGDPPDSPYEAAIEAGWLDPQDLSKALIDVMNERDRQVNEEGFDATHDDQYRQGELVAAATCYASHIAAVNNLISSGRFTVDQIAANYQSCPAPLYWPTHWDVGWWKPTGPRRDLVKAAALLIAEIDRIDREHLFAAQGGAA